MANSIRLPERLYGQGSGLHSYYLSVVCKLWFRSDNRRVAAAAAPAGQGLNSG